MTNINEILNSNALAAMIDAKRISKGYHPTLPLAILNYTALAQYAGEWTHEERVCRGLIVDYKGNIIARGPSKFFNYGQAGAPEIPLDATVWVSRKEDGSLGIGWEYEGEFGIATRGSFVSEQALHATALLNDKDRRKIKAELEDRHTPIWEIVYPENRIVLDYGGRDELIRLGSVDNESGMITRRSVNIFKNWRENFKVETTFAEALAMPVPDDEEGYVIDWLSEDRQMLGHVKLKGERYKQLHALMTNTNARNVWIQLAVRELHEYIQKPKEWATFLEMDPKDAERVDTSTSFAEWLGEVPDEFGEWVDQVRNDIVVAMCSYASKFANDYALASQIDDKRARYEQVLSKSLAGKEVGRWVDTGDATPVYLKAWKLAKPAGTNTPFRKDED